MGYYLTESVLFNLEIAFCMNLVNTTIYSLITLINELTNLSLTGRYL